MSPLSNATHGTHVTAAGLISWSLAMVKLRQTPHTARRVVAAADDELMLLFELLPILLLLLLLEMQLLELQLQLKHNSCCCWLT